MSNLACPSCYAPIQMRRPKQDGRCKNCRDALPVNGDPSSDVWKALWGKKDG